MSMENLKDNFGRTINYLRISVTDRCNLRCMYCMPTSGILHKEPASILSFEEITRIARVSASLGIKKIRVTGGEPLVRRDIVSLIRSLREIQELDEIALTTNAVLLKPYAPLLKEAGLGRINISLDSLDAQKFNRITCGGNLDDVLKGIEEAMVSGFSVIKINAVLMRGINTDEIIDFAEMTRTSPIQVRFIEYMPTDFTYHSYRELYFSINEAKDIMCRLGKLIPAENNAVTTASVFTISGFRGTIGFISALSEPFCSSCNKLRLTADGFLRSCLHSSTAINLKQPIRDGANDEKLAGLIRRSVALKPAKHNLWEKPLGSDTENFSMCQIGG